jgi:hypothetical protein
LQKSPNEHVQRGNSRGSDGLLLPLQTKSVMPYEEEELCHFMFYVKWD